MSMKISLQEIKPKKLLKKLLKEYVDHSVTSLFIIAGLLIGFSLLQVKKYTDNPVGIDEGLGETVDAPVSLQKIRLDEDTVKRLEALENDTDVIINPNLPDDRTNPFL